MTKVSCAKYGANEKESVRECIYVFCWGNRSNCDVDWCACFDVSSLTKLFRHVSYFITELCCFFKLRKLQEIFGENLGGNE